MLVKQMTNKNSGNRISIGCSLTIFNFVPLFASGGPSGGDKRVLKQIQIETHNIYKILTSVNFVKR